MIAHSQTKRIPKGSGGVPLGSEQCTWSFNSLPAHLATRISVFSKSHDCGQVVAHHQLAHFGPGSPQGRAFIGHDPRLGCAGAVFVFCNRLGGNTTSLAELHYWQGGRYRPFGAYLPKPRYSAVPAFGVRPQRQGRRRVKLRIVKDGHKHSEISCPGFLHRGSRRTVMKKYRSERKGPRNFDTAPHDNSL